MFDDIKAKKYFHLRSNIFDRNNFDNINFYYKKESKILDNKINEDNLLLFYVWTYVGGVEAYVSHFIKRYHLF